MKFSFVLRWSVCLLAGCASINRSIGLEPRKSTARRAAVSQNPPSVGSQAPQSSPLAQISSPHASPQASMGASDCYKGDAFACAVEIAIVEKTNKLRGGKRALQHDRRLSYVARLWSVTQGKRDDIGHDGFSEQRERAFSQEFGSMQNVTILAENVAMSSEGSNSAEAVAEMFAQMWWHSAGHRANMVGPYDALGVGIAVVNGAYYGTQIFGDLN